MTGLLERILRYGALRAGAARLFARSAVAEANDKANDKADECDRELAAVERLMGEIIADHAAYYHPGAKCTAGTDGRCVDRAGTRQPMPADLVLRMQTAVAALARFDLDGRRGADELDAIWQQAQGVMRRAEAWYESNPGEEE